MREPLRIFIGYDSREPVAYHVAAHSILTRTSSPVAITPLTLDSVKGLYTRDRGPTESTEFSMTRFLVPYLCQYEGYAVFMDSDMLCRTDIHRVRSEAFECAGEDPAVLVCQHDYTPHAQTKMDGQVQTTYPRKNWSSFMVFNNERCQALTVDYVNTATGLELHRFAWTKDERIGALPLTWNWLVGEYVANPYAKILHYTNGGPWFRDYANCDHADLWYAERRAMLSPEIDTYANQDWRSWKADP